MESADPNFYFMRDADGTRRVLEVCDVAEPVDMRAHGRALDELSKIQRLGVFKPTPSLKNQGMSSSAAESFKDPIGGLEAIEHAVEEQRIKREQLTRESKPYGETNRIVVPHVFRHENGLATVDRKIEIMMKTREQPKNRPRATLSNAKDLIYSSAPPPQAQ